MPGVNMCSHVYKRKLGTVKGHCRNLHAPRPRARKTKVDPRVKELEKLIRQRDSTNDMGKVAKLSADIRALRKALDDAVPPGHHRMPDGTIMKDSDHAGPPPTPTPPTDDPPPIPDVVDDAEAPATVPPPDDTDALDPSPFTGAPGTGFDGTAPTPRAQARPKFNHGGVR